MTAFSVLFYHSSGPRHHGMANPPRAGPFGVLIYSIFWMIITLPAMVISYRCVISLNPHCEKQGDGGFQLGNDTLQTPLLWSKILPPPPPHPYRETETVAALPHSRSSPCPTICSSIWSFGSTDPSSFPPPRLPPWCRPSRKFYPLALRIVFYRGYRKHCNFVPIRSHYDKACDPTKSCLRRVQLGSPRGRRGY